DAAAAATLAARGATLLRLPGPGAKVDLGALIAELGRREINEVHVEAGHKLNGSLLRAGLVDELLVYLAPMLIGPGRELAVLGPLPSLAEAQRWSFTEATPVGPDLRLRLRRAPAE
ncbi:MAG: dihydrofolate reductase family protein, partial [Burkholderiales bacterium]|nr:dihydrofolate reductase family protein [Burkholderiales bacterium]